MTRDPRYNCLFEPLEIGPVTTRNRFYQVPHCSGMGRTRPQTLAAMRGMKAEGGWGVVCTEYCSIHPSSDDAAYAFATLWDESDIKANALMTDAVHEHGSLAGVELWVGGNYIANYDSRMPPLGVQSRPATFDIHPVQSKRIDKQDIRNLRLWHRNAAKRAVEAGFDIVYVYANHGYLLSEFLDPHCNNRCDEYGGSLENRIRIVRELIEETREAVNGKCAIATRFSVDLDEPESYDAFSMLADLPDLWDLTVNDYHIEMGPSRFVAEASLQQHIGKAKKITTKPVVAVGRFTSPDTMAGVIKSGTQDLIGAARPSIADPFLPEKINSGNHDDIRECIGCNVCYAHNSLKIPIRCTQNPTMGEEWRKGWHPERLPASKNSVQQREQVLIVGAGPAGLEAARVLGLAGFKVLIAEATRQPGGRVRRESRLPGLNEWSRVTDWRLQQLLKLPNVELFLDSPMQAADVFDTESQHVLVATGSSWATDGIGRHRQTSINGHEQPSIRSVDQILDGEIEQNLTYLIFDDDHYYLGPVLASALASRHNRVIIVCPQGRLCHWGNYTDEIHATNKAVLDVGVKVVTNHVLESIDNGSVTVSCVFTATTQQFIADRIVPLTRQQPNDDLLRSLSEDPRATELKSLRAIGDCLAPGLIAAAVYSGYEAGIQLACGLPDAHQEAEPVFKRELP